MLRHASAQGLIGMVDWTIQSAALTLPSETRRALTTGAGIERLRRHRPGGTRYPAGLTDPARQRLLACRAERRRSRPHTLPDPRASDVCGSRPVAARAPAHPRGSSPPRGGFVEPTVHHVEASHHHLPPLFAPKRTLPIELHHTLVESPCPFQLDIGEMLERARPASVLGLTVRSPRPDRYPVSYLSTSVIRPWVSTISVANPGRRPGLSSLGGDRLARLRRPSPPGARLGSRLLAIMAGPDLAGRADPTRGPGHARAAKAA